MSVNNSICVSSLHGASVPAPCSSLALVVVVVYSVLVVGSSRDREGGEEEAVEQRELDTWFAICRFATRTTMWFIVMTIARPNNDAGGWKTQ